MTGSREFLDTSLSGARFTRVDLSGAVMRAVHVNGMEIDAPWLLEGGGSLVVNGVDVVPFIDAELDRRFPGRSLRRAQDPEGLRDAWRALQSAWSAALDRAASMPDGTVDVSVGGEWSFAQTLRHLVMATDTWLRRAIQGIESPYHPLGQPHAEYAQDGYDLSLFATDQPAYAEVLDARADRVAMMRDFLTEVTVDDLRRPCTNPWDPSHQPSTLECLHVILDEEWEHLRFALRDLDIIALTSTP